ncbi:winged helix DNA-binding domain-containing protein [Agromyces laixinhei]|uniref:winged helix DNA-binding domain-containing protein n=1 Tax=Agromyces laixinhei TaxID=2585717 RepID=UPI00143CD9BF|nr:winged helix DNA-binding domain-containing protein [Agromyces laixinhei]
MTTHASTSAVRTARLAAHGLDDGFDSPVTAVERLVCLQAQDLAAAKWVLGARVAGTTEATIDEAIDRRQLLRSWPMRGTLHFVAPEMLRPILRLTAARLMQQAAKTHRDEGIDDEVHAVARRVAVRELEGGRSATRNELQVAWAAAGVDTAGQRGYHLIWRLANEGLLCCGPVETRARQRFVLLDEWSPRRSDEPEDTDEILGRLFAGYTRGHGPVTVRDFAWWTGLTLTQARVAQAAAGETVTPFDAERFVAVDAPSASAETASAAPSGRHVLASFDEYFLGYGDRTAFCSDADALRVVPGKNGLFLPILVADGEVVGTWRRAPERRGTTSIDVTRFRGRPAVSRFRPAFDRWAAFWSTELGEITST